MDKDNIKNILKKAIEEGPFKGEIKKLSLFGSFLNQTNKADSDIDLLVEFSPSARVGFFKFINLQKNLAEATGRKIDLLTPESISKYFREKVLQNAEVIYERG